MEHTSQGIIYGINGPVVKVRGRQAFQMLEMVLVGHDRLIGEVIRVLENETIVRYMRTPQGLNPASLLYRPASLSRLS